MKKYKKSFNRPFYLPNGCEIYCRFYENAGVYRAVITGLEESRQQYKVNIISYFSNKGEIPYGSGIPNLVPIKYCEETTEHYLKRILGVI